MNWGNKHLYRQFYKINLWVDMVLHPLWCFTHGGQPMNLNFFFFRFEEIYLLKNVFCWFKWASKILAVSGSYKRYTSWFELETCYADLKPFAITLRLLRLQIKNVTNRGKFTNFKARRYTCTPRYEFSRMETSFSFLGKHVKWAGNLHLLAYQGKKTIILKTKQKLLPWKGRCKYYLV
jgi:hypothetical protein